MKAKAVFLVLLFVGLSSIATSVTVHAAPSSGWTNGSAKIIQRMPFQTNPNGACVGQIESIFVDTWGSVDGVCMSGAGKLRVGYFSFGGSYYAVAGFPYSSGVHVVDGLCGGSLCQYSPDKDMLVTIESPTGNGFNIVVYLHVTTRIKQTGTDRFTFDVSNPDYEIKNESGRYISTPTFAISNNGEWIVTELYNAGLALINTDTFFARQILTSGYQYGRGMDPTEELAVSNDGASVAFTGSNAGFHAVDVTPGCGQSLIGDLSKLPTTVECASSDLGIGNVFQSFYYGEAPRFLGDGQELELVVHSRSAETQRVTFLEDGAAPAHKLGLLALGDSFTSGEGETDMDYYEKGTNDVFDTCHVSTRAYPFLIGRALGITDSDVKSVACAGASRGDIIGSVDNYWGQWDRLGASGLKLSASAKTEAQLAALGNFQPGRTLQSSFIESYNPEIVTVGIGGNDTGLMGKLSSCAMPGTCEWAQGDGLRETAGEIKRLFEPLTAFYKQLSRMSPDTRFYAVGYPEVINPDGVCDPVTTVLLDHTERIFVEQSLEYLNQVIRAAASQAGFTYLDVEHSLDGKKLCDGLNSTAMNGLRLGKDISVISTLPMVKVLGAGTFHPTPVGHSLIANSILASHPNLQQDPVCAPDDTTCLTTSPDIEPSQYWDVQSVSNDRMSFVTNFIQQTDEIAHQLNFHVPDGALQPLSMATIEIHSDAVSLGTFSVSGAGGVSGMISIPKNIEAGVHTLHLYGTNRDGELVDLYQFIEVGEDGQVVGSSVDGAATSIKNGFSDGGSKPYTNNFAGVLGAQDVALAAAGVQSALSKAVQYIERVVGTGGLVWVIVVAGISTLSSILCIILMLRRWAKPGS